jgi:O-acetyl-ADP-ribose deacetylase (regulator of RNase III)
MDPLQAFSQEWQSLVGGGAAAAQKAVEAVDLEALRNWQSEAEGEEAGATDSALVFPVDPELNGRIYLFEGKIWNLRIDAIVNTTNESMSDRTGVSGQILQHAGPQLEEEIYQTDGCRTGECRMTRAYLLPCKKVIHTVGPRYNERYVTAAESALHYCYRNSMEMALENKLSSLALSCVYTERKGYPRREAAHIAIRTVRRFMEQFSAASRRSNSALEAGLSHVVFVVDNVKDLEIYRELLRMYFPRNRSDAQLQKENLPADVGNEKGEPVVQERQVRISAMPGHEDDPTVQEGESRRVAETETLADTDAESFQSFACMTSAPDASRLAGGRAGNSANQDAYERYLRRAVSEDLSSVSRLGFLYRTGVDKEGRTVFVLVASRYPAREADSEKALLYIIATMDALVHKPFVLVWVHSNFAVGTNQPLPTVLNAIYESLDRRYKKNLKYLYVVGEHMHMRAHTHRHTHTYTRMCTRTHTMSII